MNFVENKNRLRVLERNYKATPAPLEHAKYLREVLRASRIERSKIILAAHLRNPGAQELGRLEGWKTSRGIIHDNKVIPNLETLEIIRGLHNFEEKAAHYASLGFFEAIIEDYALQRRHTGVKNLYEKHVKPFVLEDAPIKDARFINRRTLRMNSHLQNGEICCNTIARRMSMGVSIIGGLAAASAFMSDERFMSCVKKHLIPYCLGAYQ